MAVKSCPACWGAKTMPVPTIVFDRALRRELEPQGLPLNQVITAPCERCDGEGTVLDRGEL